MIFLCAVCAHEPFTVFMFTHVSHNVCHCIQCIAYCMCACFSAFNVLAGVSVMLRADFVHAFQSVLINACACPSTLWRGG